MKTPDWRRMAERARGINWRGGLQWLPVVLALPLAAGATFWWLEANRVKSVEEAPVVQAEPPEPQTLRVSGEVQKDQNITEVLTVDAGLSPETARAIVESSKPVYDLAKIQVGRVWKVEFTMDGELVEFRYPVDLDHDLTVAPDEAGGFTPVLHEHQFETEVELIGGTVTSSLYNAVKGIGEKQEIGVDLGEIFASDIDFNTDVQAGDSFKALIERKYLDGEFYRNGAILAASFTNEGKTFTGFRFTDENGKPAYYDQNGRALRKSFLKAPLKVIRISSGFSTARLHPILKIVRPHLGVDYSAPTGTPVQAVGAGTVTFAGWSGGGGGNTITLRHSSGFETKYMHLSAISVKRGQRVSQGQVIGKVGATGLATGPHLDFRVYQNGKALNPVKVIYPPGEPVAKERMAEFTAVRDLLAAEMAR